MPSFDYIKPKDLKEAIELIQEDGVCPIAGGTNLLVDIRERSFRPKEVVDILDLDELRSLNETDSSVEIGSCLTMTDLERSDIIRRRAPILVQAASSLGSPQIRNRGTITGNIVNASPAADTACPLIVHDAEIMVQSTNGTNIIPIEDLFAGPKINCLEPGELVTEIRIPKPPADSCSAYKRIGRRQAFTLSVVSAAAYLQVENNVCIDAGFAFGSVAMTPLRVPEAEDMLKGKELTEDVIMEASMVVKEHVKPITDVRGTAEYRKNMCPILMRRAIQTCSERMR